MREVWFWQTIVSTHVTCLAEALVRRGVPVHYVASEPLTTDRLALGWCLPKLAGVSMHLLSCSNSITDTLNLATVDAIHICQGIRGNGTIKLVQREMLARGLQQWIMIEAINDAGLNGIFKRLLYGWLFRSLNRKLAGTLATGYSTSEWLVKRGVMQSKLFPFAYFLEPAHRPAADTNATKRPFSFIFVGQLIERKRLSTFFLAASRLMQNDFELIVIGSGKLESELKNVANNLLPGKVKWLGVQQANAVRLFMESADCLVLPSEFDGWGAVVSEALIVGTPAICSDACGSAEVVRASGVGGVFPRGDVAALTALLQQALMAGRITKGSRVRLAEWARCLDADCGADYLIEIFEHMEGRALRPDAPWKRGLTTCVD